MALGIDIHPIYQRNINWQTVKTTKVEYAWVKVSDGGVPYRKLPPDSHVKGALSIGLKTGGYHYAQFAPGPETQANILTAEVKRLDATSLAPALDLEAPFTPNEASKDFAQRFIRQLKYNGFHKVAIYGYTSMLQRIRPDLWNIPGLIIWGARPGPIGSLGMYKGRCDVHQFTSEGRIPGIAANVDCNETLNEILLDGEVDIMTPNEFWQNQQPHPHIKDKYIWMKDAVILGNEAAQESRQAARDAVKKLFELDAKVNELLVAQRDLVATVDAIYEKIPGLDQFIPEGSITFRRQGGDE